jgi:DNA replication protein DnaC
MLLEQTIDKLNQMKLFGMASSLKERLCRPDHQDLSSSDLFGLIIDDEWLNRQNKKVQSRLNSARFKERNACIENINYKPSRGIKKSQVLELAQGQWIEKHQNIAITGMSGVGKSYLAQAIGHQAVQTGHSVLYLRFPKLLLQLLHSRADGTYRRFLERLSKTNVIILDDFAVPVMDDGDKRDLLEIIEDRYATGSTILTSQLEVPTWHEYLGSGIVADAILDRIVHNCHKIHLTGPSGRKDGEVGLIGSADPAK